MTKTQDKMILRLLKKLDKRIGKLEHKVSKRIEVTVKHNYRRPERSYGYGPS